MKWRLFVNSLRPDSRPTDAAGKKRFQIAFHSFVIFLSASDPIRQLALSALPPSNHPTPIFLLKSSEISPTRWLSPQSPLAFSVTSVVHSNVYSNLSLRSRCHRRRRLSSWATSLVPATRLLLDSFWVLKRRTKRIAGRPAGQPAV